MGDKYIIRGTTPTIVAKVEGNTLEGATPYLTLKQGNLEITKSGEAIVKERGEDSCVLVVSYTQQETLQLKKGAARIQMRWVDTDKRAGATFEVYLSVYDVLKEGEIDHE